MRRALIAAVAGAIALGSVAMTVPSQAASVGNPLPPTMFGQHVPGIANGTKPTVPYGTVRLWDAGVAWGQVNQGKGKFWWNGLDGAIQNANAQKVSSLYVLGSTPTWAATNKKQGTYPNKGAASVPGMANWKDWVSAVVTRYAASIDSYQIWNEANLSTFFAGTPQQMADLTQAAYKIIKAGDPTAKVVSASSTVRLTASYDKFFPAYLTALKKKGWPVDAIAIHTYPAGNQGPAERVSYINKTKADMTKAGVPAAIELWDTEVNFGIKGPGSIAERNIAPAEGAGWLATTYLDNVTLGVARSYWYFWAPSDGRVGIVTYDGSPAATAFATIERWIGNAFHSCNRGTNGAANTCQLGDNVNPEIVAWVSSGSAKFTVPASATTQCDVMNSCSAIAPGTSVTIGSSPLWFGSAARAKTNQQGLGF